MRSRRAPATSGLPRSARSGRGLVLGLFLIVASLLVVDVGLAPWSVHMGGRNTWNQTWRGYGPVSASNGGHYVLMTELHGGLVTPSGKNTGRLSCSQFSGCDSLFGTGTLCTEGGQTYVFDLRGQVHGWWTTDGARTSIHLTHGRPVHLQSGWVVSFSGEWDGPVLRLRNGDNSFTEAFTPRGTIRTVTSTADAGTAHVDLVYGTTSGFETACRALAGHRS